MSGPKSPNCLSTKICVIGHKVKSIVTRRRVQGIAWLSLVSLPHLLLFGLFWCGLLQLIKGLWNWCPYPSPMGIAVTAGLTAVGIIKLIQGLWQGFKTFIRLAFIEAPPPPLRCRIAARLSSARKWYMQTCRLPGRESDYRIFSIIWAVGTLGTLILTLIIVYIAVGKILDATVSNGG